MSIINVWKICLKGVKLKWRNVISLSYGVLKLLQNPLPPPPPPVYIYRVIQHLTICLSLFSFPTIFSMSTKCFLPLAPSKSLGSPNSRKSHYLNFLNCLERFYELVALFLHHRTLSHFAYILTKM